MSPFPPDHATSTFERIDFIMVRPSHPGNVGAAARAIKTMGFQRLCLVAPRHDDMTSQPEAQALASGAGDVLAQAQTFDTLSAALAGTTLAFALTARPRDLGPIVCDIRQAAEAGRDHLHMHQNTRVAMVLGTERSGLTNEDIDRCQRICHIPANPQYSSLNVAQALQLAAWELRYALISDSSQPLVPSTGKQGTSSGSLPATNDKILAFMAHWEQALVSIEFLNPSHPKKLMPRMRHLFTRNQLSNDEVDMMRGVCTAMIKAANHDR
ncbi:MAG TPA: RNA methyltransferase [Pusillimonas sp.]|uniref:RNA methyltransferase n=1 Tax=Pusillimonas sp. TaxID=3040095 RepID=UPI002BEA5022|nr:RNA methyltransferase [Pusillimonas sp.]HUH87131.1 RNA methyltransferase [Pusillimonas sp.]